MLTGLDPDYTERVSVEGASFVVGVVERAPWVKLVTEGAVVYEEAFRRAVRSIAQAGEDPAEPADPKDAKSPSKAQVRAVQDPTFRAQFLNLAVRGLRYGLRGHEGFSRVDGSPVPFEMETVQEDGAPVQVVKESTLRWYRVAPLGVAETIYENIRRVNSLSLAEKKA